jgi:hypothetical protein
MLKHNPHILQGTTATASLAMSIRGYAPFRAHAENQHQRWLVGCAGILMAVVTSNEVAVHAAYKVAHKRPQHSTCTPLYSRHPLPCCQARAAEPLIVGNTGFLGSSTTRGCPAQTYTSNCRGASQMITNTPSTRTSTTGHPQQQPARHSSQGKRHTWGCTWLLN